MWGPLTSLVFTALIWLVFNLLTIGIAILFMRYGWGEARIRPNQLGNNGLFLAVSTLVNAAVCCALIVSLVRLRGGLPVADYLGLKPARVRDALMWLGILILFIVTSEGIGYWMQRPVVPEFMVTAYETAGVPVLLWLALIVAAPVFEEVLFRGFLQNGLQLSRMHGGLVLLLPAFIWAGIHLQYDFYDMSWVFLFGILLGLARWHTDSLLVPLGMHMLVNLLATVVTALMLA
ncbi:MAG: CPBP family intramembrane glutamic endopeptidase [Gammaproteobacteria bacterium]|nr:CPBP family intramembrane glutamic endopeptidase [Gammaproteobacteria bacterium]